MNKKGFTLIEILVAMVLLAMVTVIAATALRLAIRAWERGEKEGEIHQAYTAISALMGKQLRSAKGTLGKKKLSFYGVEKGVSFFTTYAPQGSLLQGFLRVTYVYDDIDNTLFLYEQAITRKEDMKDEFNPLSDSWTNSFSPTGEVEGVSNFSLEYAGGKKKILSDDMDFQNDWKNSTGTLPSVVSLTLNFQDNNKKSSDFSRIDKEDEGRTWYFNTGVLGL